MLEGLQSSESYTLGVSRANSMSKSLFQGPNIENRPLLAYFGNQNPTMTLFDGICHGNCALTYVGGILKLRKLHFKGLRGQFNVKKANFRGLIAKIGHYWHILATRTHLCTIFNGICHWNCAPKVLQSGSKAQKDRFQWSQRSNRCQKGKFYGLIAKIGYYRHILATSTRL